MAEVLTEALALLTAVTVCCPGWVPGVKSPAGETVPVVAFPPLLLSTCQVTPPFVGSLTTVAVNCTVCAADIVTAARLGLTVTESAPCVTVKLTPLLAMPLTVTLTLPVVAPLGTGAAILVLLQLVGLPAVPLNVTVLVPCVAPKFVPVTVTAVLMGPNVGLRLEMLGVGITVKATPLLAADYRHYHVPRRRTRRHRHSDAYRVPA